METDEYSCPGSGEGTCKRIGTKLSKKSYKETCKFTINSLLSKPDRPHKTPAPHVNCKITNKKAHTVFSFNDSPEKLIKIKSPHMLTAEVKKLYSPPNLEGYRYVSSGSREGLNLAKEGKYKPCTGGVYSTRPTTTTVAASFRPTTAQLLYQRQLSKQEHRTKDRSESMSDGGFDSDNDPFKFTPSSCANGHSPPFKHQTVYPPEFDKFAYHSPEHSSFEMETKLSGESKFSLQESSSGERSRDSKTESRDVKLEEGAVRSDTVTSEAVSGAASLDSKSESSEGTKCSVIPTTLLLSSEHFGLEADFPKQGLLKPTLVTCSPNLPLSPAKPIPPKSPGHPSATGSTSHDPVNPNSPQKSRTPEELQPSSKLHRGKLSFFKEAISQEVSTLQESEKKAMAQIQSALDVTEKKPVILTSDTVPLTIPSPKQSESEEKNADTDKDRPKNNNKSPMKHSPLSKDLPTNVVRKVIKRPLPPQPVNGPHLQKTIKSPVPKAAFTTVPIKKPAPKVVHSINANPIPFVMNGHKVNVVKIEKHNASPSVTQISHKDLSVFKFTNDQPITMAQHPGYPQQHPGYPVPLSEYLKVQQSRKRKMSGDPLKLEGSSKTKRAVKGSILSPPHQITFSHGPLSSPTKANGLSPTSEIVKVEHSLLNKSTLQSNSALNKSTLQSNSGPNKSTLQSNSGPNKSTLQSNSGPNKSTLPSNSGSKLSHPVKSRKNSGQSSLSSAKKTLQNKLLSQPPNKAKVAKLESCPAIKQEAKPKVSTPSFPIKTPSFPIKTEPVDPATEQPAAPVDPAKVDPVPVDPAPVGPAKVDDGLVKTVGIPTPPMSLLTDPKQYLKVEPCSDGGATVVRLDMDTFEELNFYQQNLLVDYFFEVTFGETNGLADHVMGIISNGSKRMPNVLNYMIDKQPGLKVKHEVLGKKDVLNCTIGEYYEKIGNNHSRCIYHEGGLQHISLVGTKSEESGALFPELIHLLEANPFFEVSLPWGSMSRCEGLDPAISNDGPIFWVRPGEQFLQSTSGSRNHKGYRLLKNRETLVPDRTTPHADHSWEDGKTISTTAAVAFLQPVELPGESLDQGYSLKDVIAFDAANFYQLAEELQLDLYEPPMTQCEVWIEDAKLNQLRESRVKYAKIRLKAHDMYFIPRNVIHQFKTVAACLSVAWHVRLKQYYDT